MKNISQKKLFIVTFAAVILFGLKLYSFQKSLLAIWLIAIAIGFILYRSGICFVAMYQNIILFRDYTMARAVLLMFIVSFIGINLLQAYAAYHGEILPGRLHSFGVHTAVGAFLFGLGMTLAGGCAVGTLQRIGEGFSLFWLVLLGMVAGSTTGAYHYSWWIKSFFSHKPVMLSDLVGWIPAWLGTIVVLAGLFLLTLIVEKKALKENKKCQQKN